MNEPVKCPQCGEKLPLLNSGQRVACYSCLYKQLVATRAENTRLRQALHSVPTLAAGAFRCWDRDEDHKVGKFLNALMGGLPGYLPSIDFIHETIREIRAAEKP